VTDCRHQQLLKPLEPLERSILRPISMSSSHACAYGMRSNLLPTIIDGRFLQYNNKTELQPLELKKSKFKICCHVLGVRVMKTSGYTSDDRIYWRYVYNLS
jgi:hypothetical protein